MGREDTQRGKERRVSFTDSFAFECMPSWWGLGGRTTWREREGGVEVLFPELLTKTLLYVQR